MAHEGANQRSRIADALVVVLPEGGSLSWWRDQGVLEREWAQYDAMRDWYERIVVLSPADPGEDLRALREECAEGLGVQPRVIGCDARSSISSIMSDLRVALEDTRSVVIKTAQMGGCMIAIDAARTLREAGLHVGLIARGGFLWSRFVAHDEGTNSSAALESSLHEGDLCRGSDVIVGTTQSMVEDLAWRYGLDPSRCVVVPNYVLVDHPAMAPREREFGSVLTCGPLIARKRFHLLIDAIAELAEGGGSWRLEIVGDGPEHASLAARAHERSAPVTFTRRFAGREVLEKMSRCAIYAQTSQLEGHPRAVLEAMACGAPTLVCDTPGLGVAVQHGVTGLRCPSDAGAIAHTIRELMADEDWRQVLGASASRVTQDTFGLPRVLCLERAVHEQAMRVGRSSCARRASA